MTNKTKLALGFGAVTTGAMIFTAIERSKETMSLEKQVEVTTNTEELGADMKTSDKRCTESGKMAAGLLPVEEEKIANYIKGMSEDELSVVVRNLPADVMLLEIVSRLDAYKHFAQSVQDAVGYLPK